MSEYGTTLAAYMTFAQREVRLARLYDLRDVTVVRLAVRTGFFGQPCAHSAVSDVAKLSRFRIICLYRKLITIFLCAEIGKKNFKPFFFEIFYELIFILENL